ncbi:MULTISPECIES: DUF1990 family protein [unclassified Arthrobacter]|uniref:DUF1990 family protein n=1 Tax=unclassified Arthrobacter TaxID=235627 RepID=UPI001F0F0A37|nr:MULTISPECIES: DUF1990 domain-containing protein [unclassified Arthrobacter]
MGTRGGAPGALNYPGIGNTEQGTAPAGYAAVLKEVRIGTGLPVYRRVAEGILGWELQRRAGLRVRADSPVAVPGARVVSGFGIGPFRLNAPCEVVWVREPASEAVPQTAGFGYGTLPGHPARGEESFEVEINARGEVLVRIRAFSKPANWFYAAGGLVTRAAQRYVTSRYIEGARTLAAEGIPT